MDDLVLEDYLRTELGAYSPAHVLARDSVVQDLAPALAVLDAEAELRDTLESENSLVATKRLNTKIQQ